MKYELIVLTVVLACAGVSVAEETPNPAQAAKDRTVVETLLRLKGMDVNASPAWKAAATRHLATLKGTPKFVELAEKLKLKGIEEDLFHIALEDPASTQGAKAALLLAQHGELGRFIAVAQGKDEPKALAAIAALANVATDPAMEALKPFVGAQDLSGPVRNAATRALGKNLHGQKYLLQLAESKSLPEELKFAAADVLLGSSDPAIRTAAAKHVSLPAGANSKPLPPVAELVRMKGDAASGRKLFFSTATCSKCHQVRGEGKQVGPELTEIGSKLTRDAFFVSILDPSAGISHNFESYSAVTTGGLVLNGILVSRTDDSVTLRTAEAIDKEIPTAELEELQKSPVSLMPANLQQNLSAQDLVDIVEFLATLKKA